MYRSLNYILFIFSFFIFNIVNEQAQSNERNYHHNIPNIVKQSENTITVNQGDVLNLIIEVDTSEHTFYRWFKGNKIVSTQNSCTIDTKDWAFGRHRVVAVAYNKYGSDSVEFLITVLNNDNNKPPQTYTPQLIQAQNKERLSREDFFAEGFKGIGYSYDNKKVQVLAILKRLLMWNETLKSHVNGIVRFGKTDYEEHFLLQDSIVKLSKENDSPNRSVNLLKGIIRSRIFDIEHANLEIKADDWIKILAADKSDLVVGKQQEDNASIVWVVVLRGEGVIAYHTGPESVKELRLQAGQFARLIKNQDNEVSVITQLSYNHYSIIEGIIQQTSPQYFVNNLFKNKKVKFGQYIKILSMKPQEVFNLEDIIQEAMKYNADKEYWITFETLLPHNRIGSNQFDYNMVMAYAYKNLFLFSESQKYLELATSVDKDQPQPYFELALINCTLGLWDKCESFLNQAQQKQYPNLSELYFYKGLAKYEQNQLYAAKNSFITCMSLASTQDWYEKCEDYVYVIKDKKPFGASVSLGVFNDSNIFRIPKSVSLSDNFKKAGNGYVLQGQLSYVPYYNRTATLGFNLDIFRKSYFSSSLKAVELLYEQLSIEWSMKLLDNNHKPYLSIDAVPYLGLLFVGANRSDDILALNLAFVLESIKIKPKFIVEYSSHLDPLPGRDDVIDTDTYELLSKISDRSYDIQNYGIEFVLYDTHKQNISLRWDFKQKSHKRPESKDDDYQLFGVQMLSKFELLSMLIIKPSLSFDIAQYQGSTQLNISKKRQDQKLQLITDVSYYWSVSVYNTLSLEYINQNSNISSRKYNRYCLQISTKYSL